MNAHRQCSVVLAVAVVCVAWPAAAHAQRVTQPGFLSAVNHMLSESAPQSTLAAAAIRDTYRPYVGLLVLDDFDHIEQGLATGGLVPLPLDPQRFNIRVRLDGTSPIGEMDVAHQDSYVAARAAAIGCLLDVASRVKSGPIEVTSLVRHLGYQHQLLMTNSNAATDVPTHALGLAFDIAMVNTPLKTVREIRDVLRQMSGAGDIFVIAERQQLVFHVVPQPSRLGWYANVYAHAITGQPWGRSVDQSVSLTPEVITAISSLQPLPAWADEWWAADNVPVDLPISVHADTDDAPAITESGMRAVTGRYFALVGQMLSLTWHQMSPWNVE